MSIVYKIYHKLRNSFFQNQSHKFDKKLYYDLIEKRHDLRLEK